METGGAQPKKRTLKQCIPADEIHVRGRGPKAFCTEILLFHNETCYNATIYKYAVKELLR